MGPTLYFKLQTKTCRAEENSRFNISAGLALRAQIRAAG